MAGGRRRPRGRPGRWAWSGSRCRRRRRADGHVRTVKARIVALGGGPEENRPRPGWKLGATAVAAVGGRSGSQRQRNHHVAHDRRHAGRFVSLRAHVAHREAEDGPNGAAPRADARVGQLVRLRRGRRSREHEREHGHQRGAPSRLTPERAIPTAPLVLGDHRRRMGQWCPPVHRFSRYPPWPDKATRQTACAYRSACRPRRDTSHSASRPASTAGQSIRLASRSPTSRRATISPALSSEKSRSSLTSIR